MRKFSFGFGLVALLVATPVFAEDIRGTLLRVSPDKQEVAVDVRDRGRRSTSLTLHLDADTQIMLGRKTGKLADLTVGKRVRVLYEVQNGQPIARSIIAPGVITLNPQLLETLGNLGAANGLNLGGLMGGGSMKGASPAVPAPPVASGGIGGILRRVSRTDRELVVIGNPGPGKPPTETTVFVPLQATITRDQRDIPFDDLKEGEAVVVAAQNKDGRLEAQSVTIGQPAAAGVAPPIPAPQVPVQPMPADNNNKIAKLREVLKLLDGLLEQLDAQKGPGRP
jgi:Domain of unknown function (DUF5666)